MMSLRDDLIELLLASGVLAPDENADDVVLITSGRLDSTALFEVSLWVEQRVGHPVNPSEFDVATEWDTVHRILAFVGARTGGVSRAVAAEAGSRRAIAARPETHDSSAYEIVPYEPRFRDAVLGLQKRLWSSDERLNERFFEWRYVQAPTSLPPLIYLALQDGVAVGMRAAFGSRWESGSPVTAHDVYLSDDLVVLPGHESRGLFAAFTDAIRKDLAQRGHHHFFSLSALRVTRLQSLAAGARAVGAMRPVGFRPGYVRAVDTVSAAFRSVPFLWRIGNTKLANSGAWRTFANLDASAPRVVDGHRLEVASEARPDEMARLVAALGSDGRIRHVRSAEWLAWRYASPVHDYRFVYATSGDTPIGYLILERSVSDLANQRRVNIVDWEARDDDVAEQLLVHALEHSRPRELVSWTATLGERRAAILARHGFRDVDPDATARGLPSVLAWGVAPDNPPDSLKMGGLALLDLDHWDLRMVYTSHA